MKNKLVSLFLILYIILCFLSPGLIRLRFFLIVALLLGLYAALQLSLKLKAVMFSGLIITVLLFFKIIPTPYLYLVERGMMMSVGLIVTLVYCFVIFALPLALIFKIIPSREMEGNKSEIFKDKA